MMLDVMCEGSVETFSKETVTAGSARRSVDSSLKCEWMRI